MVKKSQFFLSSRSKCHSGNKVLSFGFIVFFPYNNIGVANKVSGNKITGIKVWKKYIQRKKTFFLGIFFCLKSNWNQKKSPKKIKSWYGKTWFPMTFYFKAFFPKDFLITKIKPLFFENFFSENFFWWWSYIYPLHRFGNSHVPNILLWAYNKKS